MISSCLGSCAAAWLRGKIEVQFLVSVYIQGTVTLTISQLCSNSNSIGAGPDPSTFPVVRFNFNVGVMIDFVCNGTAKSRSCCYFLDSRAKVEYI